ncbi:MAG: hypothetical protein F4205_18110 [Gemmatimonadetes bacterium]|nr:hypothetical protein [Gemmatimonadota bacterium]MYG37389.1 hypothetical protein [Gemmatimonadota bacterium]
MSRNTRSLQIGVRCHRADYDLIERAATARGLPMAVFARRATIAAAEQVLIAGLTADGRQPLTLPERLAAMRADTAGAGRKEDTGRSDAPDVVLDLTTGGADGHRR